LTNLKSEKRKLSSLFFEAIQSAGILIDSGQYLILTSVNSDSFHYKHGKTTIVTFSGAWVSFRYGLDRDKKYVPENFENIYDEIFAIDLLSEGYLWEAIDHYWPELLKEDKMLSESIRQRNRSTEAAITKEDNLDYLEIVKDLLLFNL